MITRKDNPAIVFWYYFIIKGRSVSVTGNDTQQRLAAFIGRETEYWDLWGAIRIIKAEVFSGRPAAVMQVLSLA